MTTSIHSTIKIELQAAQASRRSQKTGAPICTPQAAPHYFQTPSKTNERFHLVTRELFRSLTFPPNSSFKTSPGSPPWDQGPRCSAAHGRSTFPWGFLGTSHPRPRQKEGPLCSETCCSRRKGALLSARQRGSFGKRRCTFSSNLRFHLY